MPSFPPLRILNCKLRTRLESHNILSHRTQTTRLRDQTQNFAPAIVPLPITETSRHHSPKLPSRALHGAQPIDTFLLHTTAHCSFRISLVCQPFLIQHTSAIRVSYMRLLRNCHRLHMGDAQTRPLCMQPLKIGCKQHNLLCTYCTLFECPRTGCSFCCRPCMYHCGIHQICRSGIEHMLHLKRERERKKVRTAVNEKERANERAGSDEKMRERERERENTALQGKMLVLVGWRRCVLGVVVQK